MNGCFLTGAKKEWRERENKWRTNKNIQKFSFKNIFPKNG